MIISGTTLLIYTYRPAPSNTDILRIFGSIGTVPISGVSNSLAIAYSIALGKKKILKYERSNKLQI
jgi:hypothetical protein